MLLIFTIWHSVFGKLKPVVYILKANPDLQTKILNSEISIAKKRVEVNAPFSPCTKCSYFLYAVWKCHVFQQQIKEQNTLCKYKCEIRRNIVLVHKRIVWALEMQEIWYEGGGGVRIYLSYEKGINKTQNKSMETTEVTPPLTFVRLKLLFYLYLFT